MPEAKLQQRVAVHTTRPWEQAELPTPRYDCPGCDEQKEAGDMIWCWEHRSLHDGEVLEDGWYCRECSDEAGSNKTGPELQTEITRRALPTSVAWRNR